MIHIDVLANNIVLFFTFTGRLSVECFSPHLFVEFVNEIEDSFLHSHLTTDIPSVLVEKTWQPIRFTFDRSSHRFINENETLVKYFILGIGDLGPIVKTLRIYVENVHLNALKMIELDDDIRHWNSIYEGPGQIDRDALIFHRRDEPLIHQCEFYQPRNDIEISETHVGVCTLKKTNDDAFLRYKLDHPEMNDIRMISTYFLIAPSSCHFNSNEFDPKIHLARLSTG